MNICHARPVPRCPPAVICVASGVDQELLLRNEYLAAEKGSRNEVGKDLSGLLHPYALRAINARPEGIVRVKGDPTRGTTSRSC